MSDERKALEQRATMTDIERLRHSASHVLATAILCHSERSPFDSFRSLRTGYAKSRMERLGKPLHRREGRRLSEGEVSESNLSIYV
jgi:hypothetical protein